MLEMIINPKKAEKRTWEMFFVGFLYSSVSIFLVNWFFAKDAVLSNYSGILVVTFTVMFSIPFIYYTLKLEERRINEQSGTFSLLKEHRKALMAFMWLFLGFVVAFSLWYILLSPVNSFKPQIETFCLINRPTNFQQCTEQYGIKKATLSTGFATSSNQLLYIFTNNIYVLIFTLVFSLIFGAGVIFILVWNASVIAAAIGIYAKSSLLQLPLGFARYMVIHGFFEILSYFTVALAGGMISVAVVKHEFGTEKFWEVLQDSLNLIIFSIVVLFIAGLLEVYVTPLVF